MMVNQRITTSEDDPSELPKRIVLPYRYGVYGVSLRSEISLALPQHRGEELAEIEVLAASEDWFVDAVRSVEIRKLPSSWYQCARLSNGSSYARWEGVGEFLVPAGGKTIWCRQASESSQESFQAYLLGRALSFALVELGFEPLHGTAVAVDGAALVFLGDSGFGKSSLAACFLSAGHRLITDDLLTLRDSSFGLLAYPGPTRIKLFSRVARNVLGEAARGVPMNTLTRKMILPLGQQYTCSTPVSLRTIYALAEPRSVFRKQGIRIRPLSRREAFMELVKNTFNAQILDSDRLKRQFAQARRLVSAVPVRSLSHPRDLSRLPAVRDEILIDFRGTRSVTENEWGAEVQANYRPETAYCRPLPT
jgi:hypothetical protein